MSVSTTRFLLQFNATGLSSLITARSTIKGISQQSYTSFNEASRSYSNLERNMMRSSNNISRSLNGVLGIMRGFAGFNIGMGVLGGMVSVAEKMQRAFVSTNSTLLTSKIIIEELLGKGKAQGFLETIQTKSAVYGVSLTESMNSSKALVEAMKMVSKKKEVRPEQLGKLLNMTYALNMMDTENRGVNYTAFSIKEMMGGQGRIDFRSLRQRLNVNLGAKQEQEIAKAFKAGDLDKGINMFSDALKRIGIDADKLLERLSSEGWTQNISKLQGYVSMAFQRIGESAFLSLIKPLRGVNDFLARQFKEGSRGGGIFREIGSSMEAFIKPSIQYLQEFGHELWKNREIAVSFFRSMSGSMINGAVSFAQIFTSFGKGLSGQKNSDGVHERVQGILGLMKTMERFGESAGKFFNSLIDPVNKLGLSINSLVSELVKLGTGHTGGTGAGGLVGGLINLVSVGANATAGAIGGVNGILGNNGNQSTGIMDKMQAGANYVLTAGMLYSMFRFKNRGTSTGTTGAGGAMGGQALANEERMVAQNGILSYEQRYAQNAGMRSVLERQNANSLALSNNNAIRSRLMQNDQHRLSLIQSEKERLISARQNLLNGGVNGGIISQELRSKANNLQTQWDALNTERKSIKDSIHHTSNAKRTEQMYNRTKDMSYYDNIILSKREARTKIEEKMSAIEQERLSLLSQDKQHLKSIEKSNKEKVKYYEEQIKLQDQSIRQFQANPEIAILDNKKQQLLRQETDLLAKEMKEKERMNKRESYFTSENINTGLNAVMTGAMVGQMASGMGASGAGASGFMASSMPTFASWGTAIATRFATMFGIGITGAFTSIILPAIVMGITAYGISDRIWQRQADYERQKREENDSIQNSEADINLSKANTRRQIAQRNFFKMNGIDPVKMTALLQSTAGAYELSARYSQSSPENQKAMQNMNKAFEEGIFSPSELKSKYGEGGADAIMKMDQIMIGGNLSIESLSQKVRKEITDSVYDKLVHSGAIKIKGAGVEGVFYTVDTEEQKANKFKMGLGLEVNGAIPVVPSK